MEWHCKKHKYGATNINSLTFCWTNLDGFYEHLIGPAPALLLVSIEGHYFLCKTNYQQGVKVKTLTLPLDEHLCR